MSVYSNTEIKRAIEQDKLQGAVAAVKNGQNPAEALYNRVKVMFGYQPKPAAAPKASEADKIAAIAKNKKMSASGIASITSSAARSRTMIRVSRRAIDQSLLMVSLANSCR